MSSFAACIFDLDGVIVDTARYHFSAWRRLANELGFDFTEEENEQLKGVGRMQSLELILSWGGKELTSGEKMEWAVKKNEWYLDLIKEMDEAEILPGTVHFLDELRANKIKVALGSASKNARTILGRIGLTNYFDAIVDGNLTTNPKPHPEVFLKGANAVQVAPESCVVFEDALKGVEAAIAGGMHVIGVGKPEILTEADHVISSLKEMSFAKLNNILKEKTIIT